MNRIKMFRHIEEKPVITEGVRGGSILESEQYLASDCYAPSIQKLAEEQSNKDVRIMRSDTDRSLETANLVADCITESSSLSVIIDLNTDLSALEHGRYKEDIEYTHSLSELAQQIYLRESFLENNPNYHHGDPGLNKDGSHKYTELVDIFNEPGESQADLNIRVYRLVLDLIERIDNQTRETLALSTHYVILSRLLALEAIALTYADSPTNKWTTGDLYKLEWDVGVDMTQSEGYKNFFKRRNYLFDINVEYLSLLRHEVLNELDFIYQNESESPI